MGAFPTRKAATSMPMLIRQVVFPESFRSPNFLRRRAQQKHVLHSRLHFDRNGYHGHCVQSWQCTNLMICGDRRTYMYLPARVASTRSGYGNRGRSFAVWDWIQICVHRSRAITLNELLNIFWMRIIEHVLICLKRKYESSILCMMAAITDNPFRIFSNFSRKCYYRAILL